MTRKELISFFELKNQNKIKYNAKTNVPTQYSGRLRVPVAATDMRVHARANVSCTSSRHATTLDTYIPVLG